MYEHDYGMHGMKSVFWLEYRSSSTRSMNKEQGKSVRYRYHHHHHDHRYDYYIQYI